MNEYILEMINVTKEFPGVKALENVSFKLKKGTIHSLCGENGAGKSTLMKVLSGVYPNGTFQGEIIVKSKAEKFNNIKDSEKVGISIIYQELALVKQMNVCENIFLGNEINKIGVINLDKAFLETEKLLKEVGLNINPATKVGYLGIGQQQLIEIAKAISKDTDILILDEPTAALNEAETDNLLNLLIKLKDQGVTLIYISHKLNEVFRISDYITILRDGKTVGTYERDQLNEDKVISLMVGRELTQRFPKGNHKAKNVVMEVKNWTVFDRELPDKKVLDNINFTARGGEILGIAGLMGAGRTELFTSIFGAYEGKKQGEVFINGKRLNCKNPKECIKRGLSYLSEDRKRYGLVLMMDICNNITMASLDSISKFKVIDNNLEVIKSNEYVNDLRIKTPSIEQLTKNLSGGNQQKVVLAKWLMAKPKVLVLDEPTRGIDVGAKFEIYNLMNKLVEDGVSIIMISSELPEILGMSDRILVIHEGKITGNIMRNEASQEKILYYATGGNGNGNR
ncbi:MAG: xylose ABC transporter ATP-binding protein [Clostridiales bacterium]